MQLYYAIPLSVTCFFWKCDKCDFTKIFIENNFVTNTLDHVINQFTVFNKKQRMGWKICMINSYICVYEWTGVLKVQSGGHFVRYPRSALSSCKYRRHASTQIKAGGWGSTNTMQLSHHSSYLGKFLHMHLSSVELKAMRTWEWGCCTIEAASSIHM